MKFDTSYYERLQDYIESGCEIPLNTEELEYYNALYMTLGVYRKYGQDNAINLLINNPFCVTRRIARRMVDESINLFYAEDHREPKALRNMIFDNLMRASQALMASHPSHEDLETYGRLQMAAVKVKRLDQPDEKKPVPIEDKVINIYSMDPHAVGIESIDRTEIGRLIDNLNIKEKEKDRIRRDAGIDDIDIAEVIDDTKDQTQDIE